MAHEKYNRIGEILEERGIMKKWLADKVGVSQPTVLDWCKNRKQPNLKNLYLVAEALELAPADLLVDGRKKEKAPQSEASYL